MIIPDPNAFTINRLSNSFFPFSVKVSKNENVTHMFLCAQRVIDVCDLIEQHALDSLVVFSVDQTSEFDSQTEQFISLEGLAIKAQTPFSAIDSKTIILPKRNLLPLLSTFNHHSLCLFDLENNWNENQVLSQVMAYHEHDWQGQESILSKLPASQIFIASHDDCYLTVETHNSDIPKHIFARALQIYAGTVLAEKLTHPFDISEIPQDLVNTFWKGNFNLTMLRETTELKEDCLRIGVSKKPYSFVESAEYVPEFWITYEIQSQKWLVE